MVARNVLGSKSRLFMPDLGAKTRLGSASDTTRVSSTNPVCFFRIGSTLSLAALCH
jgi:hypothetical protein